MNFNILKDYLVQIITKVFNIDKKLEETPISIELDKQFKEPNRCVMIEDFNNFNKSLSNKYFMEQMVRIRT